jgi:hypothetical protein
MPSTAIMSRTASAAIARPGCVNLPLVSRPRSRGSTIVLAGHPFTPRRSRLRSMQPAATWMSDWICRRSAETSLLLSCLLSRRARTARIFRIISPRSRRARICKTSECSSAFRNWCRIASRSQNPVRRKASVGSTPSSGTIPHFVRSGCRKTGSGAPPGRCAPVRAGSTPCSFHPSPGTVWLLEDALKHARRALCARASELPLHP